MIHRINCDMNGVETIAHLIKAGLVKDHECRTYREYDKTVNALAQEVKPEDTVVIDTINRAVDMFLHWQFVSLRLKPGQTASDLDDVKNPPNTLQVYGQVPFYVFEALRGFPCQLIMLAHEGEKYFNAENGKVVKWTGEMNVANMPNVVPPEGVVQGAGALLPGKAHQAATQMTSDIFRVGKLMEDKVVDRDGKQVKFLKGTRVLNVSDTVQVLAKVHVAIEQYRKLRDEIYNPTLPILYGVLGLTPKVLMFYGPEGVGKTTLACSVAQAQYDANVKKEKKSV